MVQNERNQFRALGRTQDSPDLPTSFFLEGILARTAYSGDWNKDQEEGKFPPECMDWELRWTSLPPYTRLVTREELS
ncbi:hypothetical protein E5288_WYG003548 [Bos mutus]|uniref:Uncharacterized protein n=1 Tax=Bos mutus TaxID=72004 RepID=A0A6B0RSZ2_9CETA|nr:hypothetical protein [Bos mutus]